MVIRGACPARASEADLRLISRQAFPGLLNHVPEVLGMLAKSLLQLRRYTLEFCEVIGREDLRR
jgi:hypothetical protein